MAMIAPLGVMNDKAMYEVVGKQTHDGEYIKVIVGLTQEDVDVLISKLQTTKKILRGDF